MTAKTPYLSAILLAVSMQFVLAFYMPLASALLLLATLATWAIVEVKI